MSGLIFKDSTSLYQDQAKVMFDYYRKAAEQIVKEEMRLEALIQTAENELMAMERDYPEEIAKQEKKIDTMTLWGKVLFIILVGMIILIWVNKSLKPALEKFKEEADKAMGTKKQQISNLKKEHSDIRRDYTISKLGVVYVPVASHIPFEDKNFVLDYTGSVSDLPFTLSSLKQPEAIKENVVDLKKFIENVPLVESAEEVEVIDTSSYSTSMQEAPLYDFMGGIDRHMRNLGFMLRDVNRVSVSLPIIPPDSKEMVFLKKYGTTETGDAPICSIFDLNAHNDNIKTFEKLNDMKKGLDDSSGEFIEFFKSLMSQLAESAQILTQMKVSCSSKILQYSNTIFMNTLKTSFNHYSPLLEADEIERIRTANFNFQDSVGDYTPFAMNSSSMMKYDLISQNWVAEDSSRSSFPFGMHQIHEEIMMPVILNLMEETRIERLKIYNHIKDQKIDYLNQWQRDTEDFYGRNRAESNDLINRMRETFAEYSSSLNTLKALQNTEKEMGSTGTLNSTKVTAKSNQAETLATFELQGNQFMKQQEDFMDYMDRLKEDIDAQADKFGFIEYFEASLRDNEVRQMALATDNLQDIDPRRKGLIGAGAHFASLSDIPPEPQLESKAHDDFTMNLIQMADEALKGLEIDESPAIIDVEFSSDNTNEIPVVESVNDVNVNEENNNKKNGNNKNNNNKNNNKKNNQKGTGQAKEPVVPILEKNKEVEEPTQAKSESLPNELDDDSLTYSIFLSDLGNKTETVIFTICDMLEMPEDEARNLVANLPVVLVSSLNLEDANVLSKELEETGASVGIEREE